MTTNNPDSSHSPPTNSSPSSTPISRNRRSLRERLTNRVDMTTGMIGSLGREVGRGVVGVGGGIVSVGVGVGKVGVGVGKRVGNVVGIGTPTTTPSTTTPPPEEETSPSHTVKPGPQKKSRSVDSVPYSSSPPTETTPTPNNSSTSSSGGSKRGATTVYVAMATDTITSIAAKFETTPGEVLKLNKLMSGRCIFPGMEVKVPLVERCHGDEVFEEKLERKVMERKFVKIAVRHVTDGNGVVSGTLLITPNAVMFDPNVSDPLVIEQGAESYGVILPLEVVIHAGIYSDIAMMMVERTTVERVGGGGVLVYGATKPLPAPTPPTKKEKTVKRLSFPLTWMDSSSNEDLSEVKRSSAPPTASHEKKRDSKSFLEDSDAFGGVGVLRRSFERLLPPHPSQEPTTDPTPTTTPPAPPPLPTTPTPTPPTTEFTDFTPVTASSEWYLLLTTAQPSNKAVKLPLIVSYGVKNYLRPQYWFHVVIKEQVDELYRFWVGNFESYGGGVDNNLLASRNMQLTTFSTMDLDATFSTPSQNVNVKESPSKESWEMIKSPYTKLSSLLNRSQTLLTSTSSSATNFGQGLLDSISDFASLDYNEQEVVSMSEELRQALYGFSNEDLLFVVPEMEGVSEILGEEDLKELARHLTPRAEGHPLSLLFTTTTHGFSLTTLYRRNQNLPDDTPILILVMDTDSNCFGTLLSSPLKPSDVFYGTGQSFLFNMKPFRIYKWSGDNMYFVKGGSDGVAIGAGDGKFGIWLDSDLNCGRTDSCATYANPPLVPGNDFTIATIEAWAFLSSREQNTRSDVVETTEVIQELGGEKVFL